jgi:hypothetical protein
MSKRLFAVIALLIAALACIAVREVAAQDAPPAAPPTAPAAPPMLSAPADFSLEETSGVMRSLHEVRGRLAIVFYEDRAHTDDNYDLKLMLHRFIQDNNLRGQITTYGVADLTGVDGMLQDMARTAIRAIAAQYGIQILLDWQSRLQQAPFNFPSGNSTIGVFDRQGRLRYRQSGVHGAAEQSALFRVLRQLLREPA